MTPLRQRMIEDMTIRNITKSTQRAYIAHVARFAKHFGKSPSNLGPEEVRQYQFHITKALGRGTSFTDGGLRWRVTGWAREPALVGPGLVVRRDKPVDWKG